MKLKFLTFLAALFLITSLSSFSLTNNVATKLIVPGGKWEKYTSDDGKVSISFPAVPQDEATEKDGITTHKVSAVDGVTTYFFAYTTHTDKIEDHEGLAQVSLEAFNGSIGGKIMSQGTYTYKKNNGLEAKIEIPEKGYVLYKVVLIEQTQYQIVVIKATDDFGSDADKFFKSFKLK